MKIQVIAKSHNTNGRSCALGNTEPLDPNVANQYTVTFRIQSTVSFILPGEVIKIDVSKEEFDKYSLDQVIFES